MFLTTIQRQNWVNYKLIKYPYNIKTALDCGIRPEKLQTRKHFCRMPFSKQKYAIWFFENKEDLKDFFKLL